MERKVWSRKRLLPYGKMQDWEDQSIQSQILQDNKNLQN